MIIAALANSRIILALAKHREGLSAARLADRTGALRTNASVHLTVLRNAGLVSSHRAGRSITYKVDRVAVLSLSEFLGSAAGRGGRRTLKPLPCDRSAHPAGVPAFSIERKPVCRSQFGISNRRPLIRDLDGKFPS
ncbi:ArsR/SmtB family transcription factor [Qipengyuania spongiae]|uniref:ArsR/SmtB family transcription factor n=1 Tax=Qipengyuania spongiae TaxID=2909673 RepID=UPI003B97B367